MILKGAGGSSGASEARPMRGVGSPVLLGRAARLATRAIRLAHHSVSRTIRVGLLFGLPVRSVPELDGSIQN